MDTLLVVTNVDIVVVVVVVVVVTVTDTDYSQRDPNAGSSHVAIYTPCRLPVSEVPKAISSTSDGCV